MKKRVILTVPNDIEYLPIVLNSVREMAGIMGFEQEDIYNLEMGTEEAVSNVIKYAFEKDEDASFEFILEPQTLGLNIIIKEKGIPFDPSLVHEYSIDTLKKDLDQKGLGTFLMKQVLDEVSFQNLGKEGKQTILFKYLNNKQIHELLSKKELDEAEHEKNEETLPKGSVRYKVRRMKPEEAVEVSKGAYSSYGFTYVHEDVYYPDRVRELNKAGKLISFVAITDSNEIIAHNAIECENDDLPPQKGVAFTKPKYRGQGCLSKLSIAILEEAKKRRFTGIYGRAITTHQYSQKNIIKFGFKDSAIYISSGIARIYKGIDQQKPQRESVVIMFLYINPPALHKVYPPTHHREMIESIYRHLGVNPEITSPGEIAELPAEATTTKVKIDHNSLTANISVSSYGKDAVAEVHKNLKALCLQRLETIYLYLRLDDEYTAMLTSEFEKLGFFFSGIMPSNKGNDELVLQYLNNYVINYDQLQIASEKGKELLEYIRKLDPNQLSEG